MSISAKPGRMVRSGKGTMFVEKLPANTLFSIKNGRVFRKETLVRKRYRCIEIKTGAVYLFNPMSEVMVIA